MIEKPFGTSGAHARKLDNLLRKSFTDEQIFRIDHYLAKETMLHILPLRFSNKDLIKIWGNKYIERIRVVFAEEEKSEDKIEKRGEFYDGVGALRDVGQNHVLQMLTAIVMEKPKDKTATNIQTARAQVLQKFKISQNATLVRGQYKGYLEEPEVKKDSKTETFFRVTLELKEKKWKDVPLIIESGKALDHEEMSMEIFFKNVDSTEPSLKFVIVSSGNDAYEKVLEYAIRGEKHIFTSREEVLAEWKITENIMKKWKDSPLLVYEKGSALERI